ncbi:MAG TPA: M50 family metallopeptidase [Anaerolineae bacterium]|nr:M50 family metallopeptidase [Anaerolineae bacterium]
MKKILVSCGILIGGGAVGWLIGSSSKAMLTSLAFSPPGVFGLTIQLITALLIAILIHELGHVIGGKLAGYSFIMLVVGPFKWVREQGRVRWRWNTSLNTFGGLALMIPPVAESEPSRMARYILGGPIASFCLGVFSILGLALLQTTQPHSVLVNQGGFFLVIVAAIALMTGVATLIPFSSSGFASDGGQYLDLMRGGHRAERRLLMLTLSAYSFNGRRPREWDAALVARLLELAEQRLDQIAAAAHHFAFYYYLDLGQIDHAGAELDRALALAEAYPAELRPGLWLELAYFQARYRRDPEGAAESLKKGAGGFVEAHTRARAKAAVALSKGDLQEAITAIDLALSQIDRSMDRGGAIAEKEWLLELQTQAHCLANEGCAVAVGKDKCHDALLLPDA